MHGSVIYLVWSSLESYTLKIIIEFFYKDEDIFVKKEPNNNPDIQNFIHTYMTGTSQKKFPPLSLPSDLAKLRCIYGYI
jgi:hypothetical protein